jgi:hypothetical protein
MFQQGAYLQGPDIETANMLNNLNQKINKLMNDKAPTVSSIEEYKWDNYSQSAFDCNKSTNYRSSGNLPVPILNDFSSF